MIYDLTYTIEEGMLTCGTAWHQAVEITPMGTIQNVGRNTHCIVIGSHSGTHMDAPYHFIQNGKTMEELAIDSFWGEVNVIDFRHKKQGDIVTLEDIKNVVVSERLLFAFGWCRYWKTDKFYRGYPYFTTDAVEYLVRNGMKFMAMDTPSPDKADAINIIQGDDSPNHKILLQNEVIIVEYLNNTDILQSDKTYEIVALPLKVSGADGSPARVLIKEV